jgi:excisionase family DNA binding protein
MNQLSLEYNIYMTIPEYADHLKVSERKVNYLVKQGLPSIKLGKTRRIRWQEADAWCLLQTDKASNKPAKKPRAKRPQPLAIPAPLATLPRAVQTATAA